MTFHNAYNFVPAPHRPTRGSMAECEPVGHDHLGKDLVHGRLQVTMTTQTPLVVGEYAPLLSAPTIAPSACSLAPVTRER